MVKIETNSYTTLNISSFTGILVRKIGYSKWYVQTDQKKGKQPCYLILDVQDIAYTYLSLENPKSAILALM